MTTPSLTRYECYSKCSRRGRGEQNTIELEDYAFKLTYLEKYKMKVSLQLIFSKKNKKRNHYAVAIILEMSNEQSQWAMQDNAMYVI